MSIEHQNRLKSLEAWKVIAEDRLAKIEAYITGVEVSDDLAELDDVEPPKRRRGRPPKNAVSQAQEG